MKQAGGSHPDARFVRRLVLALLVLFLAWIFWQLRFVLVLAFGSVLFAVILHSAAGPLKTHLRLPEGVALALALVLIVGILVASLGLFGSEVISQAENIRAALPEALDVLRRMATNLGLGAWFEARIAEVSSGEAVSGGLGRLLMGVGDSLTNLIVLLVGGIFFAANPGLYRTGVIKLVPPGGRSNAATALTDCHTALRLWLKGRLLAMLLVGLLTGVGLWLIGVPSFLALGILAGLLEFIPFFGPIISAVPAVMLAMLIGPTEAALTALLFLGIQQLEGNLISPVVQQQAVELPPALLIFALLAFGLLFGMLGVVLAEPLTAAIYVLVKRLYVREALGTKTPMPGEETG